MRDLLHEIPKVLLKVGPEYFVGVECSFLNFFAVHPIAIEVARLVVFGTTHQKLVGFKVSAR